MLVCGKLHAQMESPDVFFTHRDDSRIAPMEMHGLCGNVVMT